MLPVMPGAASPSRGDQKFAVRIPEEPSQSTTLVGGLPGGCGVPGSRRSPLSPQLRRSFATALGYTQDPMTYTHC